MLRKSAKERAFTVTNGVISYGAELSAYGYQYDECNNLTKLTCSVLGSHWSTVYTYDKDNRAKKTTLASGKVIENTFDPLGRVQKRTIKQGNTTVLETTVGYVDVANSSKTSALVSTYQNGSDAAYAYEYDAVGNITEITQGTTSITYEYDAANRLIRENNGVTNQTIVYDYTDDLWGNIQNKKIYAYTTADDLTALTYTPVPYAYTNADWGDQLIEYNGQTITYDSMGNPTSYRGYTFGWRGKQLTSASNGTNSLTFEYNEDGLRQKKTVNNIDTNYFYNGSVLIGMQRGTSTFLFSYDASGSVVSVNWNGDEYFYLRNAQGDIVKIIDASGNTVVEYTYDTWGKKVNVTGSLAGTLGTLQPFRYRGYVYDWETGFYYLQSRYYDPAVGRFISADVLLSTGQGVMGYNCYAYCLDNPVCRIDPSGSASIKDLLAFLKNLIEGGGCGGYTGGGGAGSSSTSSSNGVGNSASTVVGTGGNTVVGIAATIKDRPEEESQKIRIIQENSLEGSQLGEEAHGVSGESIQGSLKFSKPNVQFPGSDPLKGPSGTEWKGKGLQGSRMGNYYNPSTGDSWHPDLSHGGVIGPHWDYHRKSDNSWWRVYEDGRIELKSRH